MFFLLSMEAIHDKLLQLGNRSLVCQHRGNSSYPANIFLKGNPLKADTSLLLFQIFVIFFATRLVHFVLRPLGQLQIISHLFAGLLLGPSVIGHSKVMGSVLFPDQGVQVIETFTVFGVMFFLFSLAVKLDPKTMVYPGRRAAYIGIIMFVVSLGITICVALILYKRFPVETRFSEALPYIAASQALTGFPIISSLLSELRISNSDIGRLALSSCMFCDLVSILISILGTSIVQNQSGRVLSTMLPIASSLGLFLIIVFLVKPIIQWMIRTTPHGKPMAEFHMFLIFTIVLVTGFVSECIGQHYVLGPMFLGMIVPDGPPLGTAIEDKVETFVSGILYPTFVATCGLQTNVFQIRASSFWIMGIIVFCSWIVKLVAVMVPAVLTDVPYVEAFILGLILNAKGIVQLVLFNLWRNSQVISSQEFALCIIFVIMVTGLTSPVVKILYDPTRHYVSAKRCTIQHARPEAELRILVCVHNNENIPTLVNLVEVSYASQENPLALMAMVLVNLVGRITPVLLSHKERRLEPSTSNSGQIISAFRNYERHNEGHVIVQTFTAIADFQSMHVDICQVAVEERANIMIVPFHKQWAVDGTVGMINREIREMNLNLLDKAPCSVGILIDRGIMRGTLPVLTSQTSYHVAVLYFGGQDDAEALAYGSRMAKHERVILTIIRFLLFGSENTKDRRHDTELIYEYRHANIGNDKFAYVEEVVRDGVALASYIKGMADSFDLILVGRRHGSSPIFSGLDQWSECPELGVIPDMLASPDFESTASVLVIQQQRVKGIIMNHTVGINPRDAFLPTHPYEEPARGSFAISVEKPVRT